MMKTDADGDPWNVRYCSPVCLPIDNYQVVYLAIAEAARICVDTVEIRHFVWREHGLIPAEAHAALVEASHRAEWAMHAALPSDLDSLPRLALFGQLVKVDSPKFCPPGLNVCLLLPLRYRDAVWHSLRSSSTLNVHRDPPDRFRGHQRYRIGAVLGAGTGPPRWRAGGMGGALRCDGTIPVDAPRSVADRYHESDAAFLRRRS